MRHYGLAAVLLATVTLGCSGGPDDADASADPDGAAATDAAASEDAGAAPCTADDDCNDGLYCNGEETCGDDGLCADADPPDCDDGLPCTLDVCSEALRECVSEPPDADDDGVADIACLNVDGLPFGLDCDDDDPNRFPGNPEVCDTSEHDEDCDDSTYGALDGDSDGHDDDACCNVEDGGSDLVCGDDCNDGDANVSPSDAEVCNGVDDDCDGRVDEGFSPTNYYPDCDGDDFGDIDGTARVDCRTPPTGPTCTGGGGAWVTDATDCDDDATNVFPGQTEVCNGVDDDCQGGIDEAPVAFADYYPDCDGDGFGDEDATALNACTVPPVTPSCTVGSGAWVTDSSDCDDEVVSVFPGQTEVCNDVDDDCADGVDEGLTDESWYPDCDQDGWGDRDASPVTDCVEPASPPTCTDGGDDDWATRGRDCDDGDASVSPDASETCNGTDDDCNDLTDDITEGVVTCELDEVGSCTNDCGVSGTRTCQNDCLGWQDCSSFGAEVCNYCDDDLDGLADDAALAMQSADTRDRGSLFGCLGGGEVLGDASCEMSAGSPPFTEDVVLLDGTAENQAGAVWLRPTNWRSGHGPTEVVVRMRVRTVPGSGTALSKDALGGWAVMVSHGATGVGNARNAGVPNGVAELVARWHWDTFMQGGFTCTGASTDDTHSGADSISLLSGGRSARRPSGAPATYSCNVGTLPFSSASQARHLGTQTSFVTQRMRLRYTPDDAATTGTDEEKIEIFVGPAGSDALVGTWAAEDGYGNSPDDDLPAGSALRIGISAGTYTESSPPWVGGVSTGTPVEARVQLYRFEFISGVGGVYDMHHAHLTVDGLCSAPPG